MSREAIGRRFARLTTDAVVRKPALWRLFRALMRRQFDSLAPRWDQLRAPGHLTAYEAAFDAIEPEPTRALDLGTGTGAGAFAIARRFPGADVVGADISARMLAEARAKTPPDLAGRVRFEQADASALPYPGARFDLVGLANMIPFFDELARVVVPGGYVLFSFSSGPATPIYVASERLRTELSQRGFAEFADFRAGTATAFLARKVAAT